MLKDELEKQPPRIIEIIVGAILALISLFFAFLILYILVLSFRNQTFGIFVLSIDLIIGLIAFFIGSISYRLLKGRPTNGNPRLLSNTTIQLWGFIFGVAGCVGLIQSLFNGELGQGLQSLFLILLAIGSYQFLMIRAKKTTR